MLVRWVLIAALPALDALLLPAQVACRVPPREVLLVAKDRSRYEALFELELEVCAGAEKVDEFLFRGERAARSLPYLSGVRFGFLQMASAPCGSPEVLVERAASAGIRADARWTLEHVPLWSTSRLGRRSHDSWRFSGLALALAQSIGGRPSLLGTSSSADAASATTRFAVLEGSETLRFGVVVEGGGTFRDDAWKERPFAFSGGLDPEVSRALVNVAVDSCGTFPGTFFDPCAGSGTNLYSAALRGIPGIAGGDVDATKVRGCGANLERARVAASVETLDASVPFSKDADCFVLNLPWGERVREEPGGNDRILRNVAGAARKGTPVCVLGRGTARSSDAWARLGFDLRREVDIFPGRAKRGRASFRGCATAHLLVAR